MTGQDTDPKGGTTMRIRKQWLCALAMVGLFLFRGAGGVWRQRLRAARGRVQGRNGEDRRQAQDVPGLAQTGYQERASRLQQGLPVHQEHLVQAGGGHRTLRAVPHPVQAGKEPALRHHAHRQRVPGSVLEGGRVRQASFQLRGAQQAHPRGLAQAGPKGHGPRRQFPVHNGQCQGQRLEPHAGAERQGAHELGRLPQPHVEGEVPDRHAQQVSGVST